MNLKQLIQQQEEAFDKDMSFKLSSCGDEECNSCKEDKKLHEDFKSFLHSSIQTILRGMILEIEGMKMPKEHGFYAQPVRAPSHIDTCNKALSDVITIIKEGIKE